MQNNIENNMYTEEKNNCIQEFINAIKLKFEKEKILVVDRFEEDFAVCEDRSSKKMINIEISKLPEQVKEGDILRFKNNKYEIDEEKREEIEKRINDKIKNLFND